MCQPFCVLFTPKTYGKGWTRFLGLSFCAASLVFALFAISAPWMDYGDPPDRIFVMLGFVAAAFVFGALGRDQWKRASKMSGDKDRNR